MREPSSFRAADEGQGARTSFQGAMEVHSQVNKALRSGFQGPYRYLRSGENKGARCGFQGAMEVPSQVNKGLRSGFQGPWRYLVR